MKVLVHGVSSTNKGSQLLLLATAERLRDMGHEPVVDVRNVVRRVRREARALPMLAIERLGKWRSLGIDRLPRELALHLPLLGGSSFDYVLDASGFSLTDAWGAAPARSRVKRLHRWTSTGVGFSMLPQAFGPLTEPGLLRNVGTVVNSAERIWARDEQSMSVISPLLADSSRLTVAPDVTIAFKVRPDRVTARDAVLVVPNWNIGRRAGVGGTAAYIDALGALVRELKPMREVVGMCHEGVDDLDILLRVSERVGGIRILAPASGVECKRIIAGAELVIGGRYHALVSALSSGVPVLAHSWSHKYASLLTDFGLGGEYLADAFDAPATAARVAETDWAAVRLKLHSPRRHLDEMVEDLWREVETILSGHEERR